MEKDLPKKGPLHEEAIEKFERHGIKTVARNMDADKVAQNVLEHLQNILNPPTGVNANRYDAAEYHGRERLELLASAAEGEQVP